MPGLAKSRWRLIAVALVLSGCCSDALGDFDFNCWTMLGEERYPPGECVWYIDGQERVRLSGTQDFAAEECKRACIESGEGCGGFEMEESPPGGNNGEGGWWCYWRGDVNCLLTTDFIAEPSRTFYRRVGSNDPCSYVEPPLGYEEEYYLGYAIFGNATTSGPTPSFHEYEEGGGLNNGKKEYEYEEEYEMPGGAYDDTEAAVPATTNPPNATTSLPSIVVATPSPSTSQPADDSDDNENLDYAVGENATTTDVPTPSLREYEIPSDDENQSETSDESYDGAVESAPSAHPTVTIAPSVMPIPSTRATHAPSFTPSTENPSPSPTVAPTTRYPAIERGDNQETFDAGENTALLAPSEEGTVSPALSPDDDKSSGLGTPAKIVFVAIALGAAAGLLALWLRRRRKKHARAAQGEAELMMMESMNSEMELGVV